MSGRSRASNLFSTLRVTVLAFVSLLTKVFTWKAVKAPQKVVESPVCLVVLSPDENPDDDITQSTPPFKLCHGAEHRLEVKAPEGSTWVGQPLSLRWLSTNSNLPGKHGLSTVPPLHMADGDETERYQDLPSAGADWMLTATSDDDVLSGDVKLALGSYWQAPKYAIDAHVGDPWYGITDLAWDGTVPIVGAKPTTLVATVSSAFADTRAIPGVEVEWTIGVQPPQRIETNADGTSAFAFSLTQEDIKDDYVTVKAACKDAFGHETVDARELRAFVKAPWNELMTVVLREKGGPVVDPSALGMRLTRGVEYELTLTPQGEDDYFVGHMITLDWFEGSLRRRANQLGIDFQPKSGRTMPKEGLTWDVSAGEQSGQFTLQAWSQTLGQGVPFHLDGVQMSANLADEAEWDIALSADKVPPIFQAGVHKTVRIVPKDGSPLGLAGLEATLMFDKKEEYLTANYLSAVPAYGKPNAVSEEGDATWTIKPNNRRGEFGLHVEMPGFTTPLKLETGYLMSSHLYNDATVVIENDDGDVDLGSKVLVLRRNKSLTIKLVPKAHRNTPLGRTGLKGWIEFEEGSLKQDKLTATPTYNKPEPITAEGLSWTLKGDENVSGNCTLYIKVESFDSPCTIAKVVLLSSNLGDEVVFTHAGNEYPRFIFRRNGGYEFLCQPKAGSPLALAELDCSLNFVGGEGALAQEEIPASPKYGDKRKMTEEGLGWRLESQNASGWFDLIVAVEGFDTQLNYPKSILLSKHLSDEVELQWEGGVEESPRLMFRRNKRYGLQCKPKSGSPLALAESKCSLNFTGGEGALAEKEIPASPKYGEANIMTAEGLTWTLDSKNASGWFGLSVRVDGFSYMLDYPESILVSERLSDEVYVTRDDERVESQLVLHQDTEHPVSLHAKPGSPILKLQYDFQLIFAGGGLSRDKVTASPDYEEKQNFSAPGLGWTLKGEAVRGVFDLKIKMDNFKEPLALSNSLLVSSKLEDELLAYIGGPMQKGRVIFRRGEPEPLDLSPLAGSPLEDVAITAWLTFNKIANVTEDKVIAVPPYSEKKTGKAKDLKWSLTGVDVSGVFGLELHVEGFSSTIRFDREHLISQKIADEVSINPISIELRDHDTPVLIEVTLKPGSPLVELGGSVSLHQRKDNPQLRLICKPVNWTPLSPEGVECSVEHLYGIGEFILELTCAHYYEPIPIPGKVNFSLIDTVPDE